VSDASPPASRLATPRWLDTRLVIGVVLVLLAVVVGARVFATADRYTRVYVASHPLAPGEHLVAGDLTVGQVRFHGQGDAYIAVTGAPPVGYLVTRYVGAHELVPLDALSASATAAAASRFVTVPVQPGHLPDDLGHGDLVDVYLTAKPAGGAAVPAPTLVLPAAAVADSSGGARSFSGTSTISVVLSVPTERVGQVVHAVESGTIDLVRVPATDAAAVPSPAATADAG
jgi:hypothetical protein